MKRPSMQAVIFDMDGLLIDSEPLWHKNECKILQDIGVDTSHVPKEISLGLRIDQVVALHYQASPWQGITPEEVIKQIIDATMQEIIELRPLMPGVKEALTLCSELGLKIGLASASPLHMLETVLDLFDIRSYFSALTSAQLLAYSKPHPDVYLLTAEKLNVPPLLCTAIEDSFNGMISAKAARMRAIMIPEKSDRNDPRWASANFELSSLLELNKTHLL